MIRPARLRPGRLPATSPTLNEVLIRCPQRAAFSSDRSFDMLDRPTPGAVLGTVCHRIMAAVVLGEFDGVEEDELEQHLRERWEEEVQSRLQEASAKGQEVIPPDPSRWSYYQVKRVRLIHRAAEEVKARKDAVAASAAVPHHAVEAYYEGYGGRLRGRADLIRSSPGGVEIVDFKTGSITEWDERTGAEVLRHAYRRQLLLYAALHFESTGEWPFKATVDALDGRTESFEVDPDEAEAVLAQAIAALEGYNQAVERGRVEARPGRDSCQFCPYRGVCGQFLSSVDSSWDLYHVYLRGRANKTDSEPGGRYALSLSVSSGNTDGSEVVLHNVPESELAPGSDSPEVSVAAAERTRSPRDIRFGPYTQLWYW